METLTCIALARELHRLLRGMRVLGAEQGEAGETLLLHMKKTSDAARESGWLMASACGGESSLFFCARKPKLSGRLWPAPLSPHIEGTVVRSVTHHGMDRTIAVSLRSSGEKEAKATLLVELFAARVRAHLIDPKSRELIAGFGARPVEAPEGGPPRGIDASPSFSSDKLDPLAISAEALAESLPASVTEAVLVERIFGVGKVLAREVIARAGPSGEKSAKVLKELVSVAAGGSAQGYLVLPGPGGGGGGPHAAGEVEAPTGRKGAAEEEQEEAAGRNPASSAFPRERAAVGPMALAFEPSAQGQARVRRCSTVNDAVRRSFNSRRRLVGELRARQEAAKELRAQIRRAARTRRSLIEELEDARGAGEQRLMGELILANIAGIGRGLSCVELPDPREEGAKVRVSLDPRVSAAENAALYFKRARKLQKKLAFLPGRVEELARRERELASELKRIESGRFTPTPHAHGGGVEKARGGKWPVGVSPRRFITSDGWTMYVGRNNKENDYLTFSFAKPDDIWFHAQGVPGSHVVLRREGRKAKPSRRCIEETASAAAYFSKGRTSQTVSVIYTEKRYVRKPRRGAPGAALCTNERAVMVGPRLPREPE